MNGQQNGLCAQFLLENLESDREIWLSLTIVGPYSCGTAPELHRNSLSIFSSR